MKLKTALEAQGIHLHHLDLGGGLGIQYTDEQPPAVRDYILAILTKLNDPSIEVIIEPGRAIAGNAGVLLTEVEYLKPTEHKNFAIIDAAMNDLIRPALYQSYQTIQPVTQRKDGDEAEWDIVGPVCEIRRLFRQRPPLELESRRHLGGHVIRRLRFHDEFELQYSPARGRSVGGRRPGL